MAAYRRIYDSRHLQADCREPGSAPEQYTRQSSMGYLFTYRQRCVCNTVWLACNTLWVFATSHSKSGSTDIATFFFLLLLILICLCGWIIETFAWSYKLSFNKSASSLFRRFQRDTAIRICCWAPAPPAHRTLSSKPAARRCCCRLIDR